MVPKNMTHLLQPLDVTTNGTIKKIEKQEFSNYIASIITNERLIDPALDVTTIRTDSKLSTLKPLHLNKLIQIFNYFKTSDGESIILSGFQATGTTNAIANARQGNIPSVDSYIQIIYYNQVSELQAIICMSQFPVEKRVLMHKLLHDPCLFKNVLFLGICLQRIKYLKS